MARPSFEIGPVRVRPGLRRALSLPITRLVTGAEVELPIRVIHGREDGPVVWIDAAIHGDEAVGVEVVRQVLADLDPKAFRGTLIAVPIVNVLGFMNGSRYLPDRRDLNRSFPGSPTGSLAGRIAHEFMTSIVERCDVGLDLHTGSDHRTNLPQIRADLDDDRTSELASVFGAPVSLHSRVRDGSLREAAVRNGVTTLLFEGGQAWRFDTEVSEVATAGTLRVLLHLGMIESAPSRTGSDRPTITLRKSSWMRAPMSGLVRMVAELGETVNPRQPLAVVADAVGTNEKVLRARSTGIVIGRSEQPVTNRGDALVHLATFDPQEG
jgi:predicted deacylase